MSKTTLWASVILGIAILTVYGVLAALGKSTTELIAVVIPTIVGLINLNKTVKVEENTNGRMTELTSAIDKFADHFTPEEDPTEDDEYDDEGPETDPVPGID